MTEVARRRDRVLGLVAAFVAGAVVGTIGTFKHQVGISAATGAGSPIGLVLSLAMVAAFLVALRVAFPSRRYAVAAAAGVVLAIAVLSLRGASGASTVVLLNPAGVAWTIAPVVVAAVVVVWPRRRPGERADEGGILEVPAKKDD